MFADDYVGQSAVKKMLVIFTDIISREWYKFWVKTDGNEFLFPLDYGVRRFSSMFKRCSRILQIPK